MARREGETNEKFTSSSNSQERLGELRKRSRSQAKGKAKGRAGKRRSYTITNEPFRAAGARRG